MPRVNMDSGKSSRASKPSSGGGSLQTRQIVTVSLSCVAILVAVLMVLWSQSLWPFTPKQPPPPPPIESYMTPEQKADMAKQEQRAKDLSIKRPPSGS